MTSLTLRPKGPYDLRLSATVYALNTAPPTAALDGDYYWFSVNTPATGSLLFRARQAGHLDPPELVVESSSSEVSEDVLEKLLTHVLATGEDLQRPLEAMTMKAELLPLVKPLAGIHCFQAPTVLEALISGIIHQQVSLKAAQSTLGRLIVEYGDVLTWEAQSLHCFPSEAKWLSASEEDLRRCGLSAQKARAIRTVTKLSLDGALQYDNLCVLSSDDVIRHLTDIKGVGQWTAKWVLSGALRRPQISSTDLALKAMVNEFLGEGKSPEAVLRTQLGDYAESCSFLFIAAYVLRKYHGWVFDNLEEPKSWQKELWSTL